MVILTNFSLIRESVLFRSQVFIRKPQIVEEESFEIRFNSKKLPIFYEENIHIIVTLFIFHGLSSLKLHIRTNIYCCYSSIVHNAWSWSFTLSFLHFHLNCFNFRKILAYKYAISFFLSRPPTSLPNVHYWTIITVSKYVPQKVLGHDNNNFWPSYLM